VFFLTDDQRWDALGCMGNRIIRTPHVDRLASRGVTFTNAFVTTAICAISRASIFTGQYARTHGCLRFNDQFSPEAFRGTYPYLLREGGYWTGFIGKFGLDKKPLPEDQFDFWAGFAGLGNYYPKPNDEGTHLTRRMGEQAIEFLSKASRDKPFFLQISFKAPHVQDVDPRQFLYEREDESLYKDDRIPVPPTAAPRYISEFPLEIQRSEARRRWAIRFSTPELYQESVKGYYRLITGVDRVVGRVIAEIDRQGLADNTVYVFSSDNGFYLAEHGLAGKWFPHEESIRVPLLISDPRLPDASRGLRRNEMALNIDIAPTLLSLAGLPASNYMHGRDLLPLLRGEKPAWRRDWFYEHDFENIAIPRSEGVRTERWKYAIYTETKPVFEELYDLSKDPREENNLARKAEHQKQLERARERRLVWLDHLRRHKPETPWREPDPPAWA
jgi:arylsulfatase A-like enzyme